ncbi:MAG: NADH-quinone oxidoreductase subunit L [Actinobacteria bacterium BACL15 MAG-120619-bin91]|jgi:NADH-quinone oxidoreductase subunit L|uniref:NADH-quinone oxidoreductase subunit L n=1 Tax=Actinobacteria bacterium BACL15 MAG-120619-bin91 TaxID=1655562 RepID=A0A0R2PGV8_9ACTN|nr:MAG: NADH-quinone oxidoreductase subunit L [Actinobacteria bacterium BACL15 MAG-120619-bin91]
MFISNTLVYLIALPLAGAAILLLAGRRTDKWGHLLATAMSASSFGVGLYQLMLMLDRPTEQRPASQKLFEWIHVGEFKVDAGLLLDQLSICFVLLITGVGTLIHIYSISYMSHDKDRRRFFAYLNLFIASMLLLVLGDSYLNLYVGWEGVGLASYLLIGFWNQKPAYATASKKAFVMNRVGDMGLSFAIMIAFATMGTVSFVGVQEQVSQTSEAALTAIGLMLLVAAAGKSAQFPLQAWLGDAMAGPTPVSALIHAATMVTAGVYLITRSNFVFDAAPTAQLVVVIVGAITLMFGALIGTAKDDIKKALAASTMSQIGYMTLAAGLGPVGYAFAIMHLLTHGFFKAGMFLGAGSVMHGMNDEVNMRKYGALRKFMPITFVTFGLGYLAILGIPPFAGFYSKDLIIETAFDAGGAKGIILGITTLIGASITAFYMTRVMILTFTGTKRWDGDAHPHESPWLMWLPMAILAIGSVSSGYLLSRGDALENWLYPLFDHSDEYQKHLIEPIIVSGMALTMVAIGVAVAYFKYARQDVSSTAPEDVSIFTKVARQDLMQDRFNEAVFMRPGQALTTTLIATDQAVVDGAVRGVGQVALSSGSALRGLQNGYVRSYAAIILVGAIALIAAIWVVVS